MLAAMKASVSGEGSEVKDTVGLESPVCGAVTCHKDPENSSFERP